MMRHSGSIILAACAALALFSCSRTGKDGIVRVKDGKFVQDGRTVSFIGANFWYGAILASEGEGGNYERLTAELDTLRSLGVTNLRVMVGGDGPDGVPTRIEPTLQKRPGVYNDTLLLGLDRLLVEMGKRDMKAVLFLNNAWEWSGGFGCYLEWAGAGKALLPLIDGYWPFMQQMAQFSTNTKAQELFYDHIRNIVGRTNSITGKPYREDPAIFSWQIANEPRCFSSDTSVQRQFVDWIAKAARVIKETDPNHMVSTGSEGAWGCEYSYELFERVHSCPDIDYLTMHIWPYNWGWAPAPNPTEHIGPAIDSLDAYVSRHLEAAARLGKPIVAEEFGFPRDGMNRGWGTWGRDRVYSYMCNQVVLSDERGGMLRGLNFWGWGGYARYAHDQWQKGDDYCGDPAQEAQGLNSVYVTDVSTTDILKDAAAHLQLDYSAEPLLENDWLYTVADQKPLRAVVRAKHGKVGRVPVTLELKTDAGEAYRTVTVYARPGRGADTVEFRMSLEPGFYKAGLYVGDALLEKEFNIGCDPEAICSPRDAKEDFEAFWEKNRMDLDKVAPGFRRTLVPERSNGVRRTYIIDMVSYGGEPVRGILVEPVAEGTYPVRITFNGYSSFPWWEDPSANPGQIDFTLCSREQGISNLGKYNKDWICRGLASKESYYYLGAYMDCVRGVEFVLTLEKADKTHIYAEGASQGGAFTMVTAALMPGVFKCIIPQVPFMSDFPDYFKVASWPAGEILPRAEKEGLPVGTVLETLSYFDVKNFAKYITCPTFMLFALQDETCPPHTNFAGYNLIEGVHKQWKGYPLSTHGIHLQEPDLSRQKNAFLKEYFYD